MAASNQLLVERHNKKYLPKSTLKLYNKKQIKAKEKAPLLSKEKGAFRAVF